MNDSKLKEYVKIGGIVGGIVLSSTSLVNQHNDTSTYEVRMKALEMHVEAHLMLHQVQQEIYSSYGDMTFYL